MFYKKMYLREKKAWTLETEEIKMQIKNIIKVLMRERKYRTLYQD